MDIFAEITFTLIIAFTISGLMVFLKQPLLIGYIIAGILVGPYGFNIVTSTETIELFAKLGITALLFIVGINLSPNVIKEVGKVALITGVGQVLITSLIGYLIVRFMGFGALESIYIAIAMTFSSTIIILKLLADKGDTNKLYGRIAVGFLLVQDLIATIILVIVSSISTANPDTHIVISILVPLIKGFIALIGIFVLAKYILPILAKLFSKSTELLFVFSIAWGIGIGLLYLTLGLSIEIGALVAGISLSMTPFAYEISSRLKPLRDFFIILFFINLGHHLEFNGFADLLGPTAILSAYILIGNPLIVYILMNILGFTRRTGFLTGLTVAQISEFSLILIALGVSIGHVSQKGSVLITLVGLVTIGLSSYLIIYSNQIYKLIHSPLKLLEFKKGNHDIHVTSDSIDALLFGCDRVGVDFIKVLEEQNLKILIIDHNPQIITALLDKGLNARYGDADDIEFLAEIDLKNLKIVISTIPDYSINKFLIEHIRKTNLDAAIIVISENLKQSQNLYEVGATYVVMPHYVGAHIASNMISEFGDDYEKYKQIGKKHLAYLQHREEIIHH